ncbi:hypothetical protein [Pseudomonas sp. GM78]|uniref:hypothetical protein n=1 Tax=Pseudomonas sp. GM78 TaxID=1144337 RepID=UPI0012FCF49E|nr:hypothetical protein [Pseudomonas sp. GM78]
MTTEREKGTDLFDHRKGTDRKGAKRAQIYLTGRKKGKVGIYLKEEKWQENGANFFTLKGADSDHFANLC